MDTTTSKKGSLAHLVERVAVNRKVDSSILSGTDYLFFQVSYRVLNKEIVCLFLEYIVYSLKILLARNGFDPLTFWL